MAVDAGGTGLHRAPGPIPAGPRNETSAGAVRPPEMTAWRVSLMFQSQLGDLRLGHQQHVAGGRDRRGRHVEAEDRLAGRRVAERSGDEGRRPSPRVRELDEDDPLEAVGRAVLDLQRLEGAPDPLVDGRHDRDVQQDPVDRLMEPAPGEEAEEVEQDQDGRHVDQRDDRPVPPGLERLAVEAEPVEQVRHDRGDRPEDHRVEQRIQVAEDEDRDDDRQGHDQAGDDPAADRIIERRRAPISVVTGADPPPGAGGLCCSLMPAQLRSDRGRTPDEHEGDPA